MPRYHLCFAKSSGYVLILTSSSIFNPSETMHLGYPQFLLLQAISSSIWLLKVRGPSELWTNHSILLMPLSFSLFFINCHDFEYPVQVDDTYVSISSLDFFQFQGTVISDHLGLTGLSISTLISLNHFSIILFQRYIHCSEPFIDFMLNYMNNIPNPYI